jgi:hypothetical protein
MEKGTILLIMASMTVLRSNLGVNPQVHELYASTSTQTDKQWQNSRVKTLRLSYKQRSVLNRQRKINLQDRNKLKVIMDKLPGRKNSHSLKSRLASPKKSTRTFSLSLRMLLEELSRTVIMKTETAIL